MGGKCIPQTLGMEDFIMDQAAVSPRLLRWSLIDIGRWEPSNLPGNTLCKAQVASRFRCSARRVEA